MYDLCSFGTLDAVNGPDGNILGFGWVVGIGDVYRGLKGFDIWRGVGALEGDMIGRMPIFGRNFQSKGKGEKIVDNRGNVSSSGNGERSILPICQ